MLTKEVRREKAHRHFITTFGEEKGTPMWKDYCQKSGLMETPKKDPIDAEAPKAQKRKKSGG
jgi:hypothetical protein